MENARLTIICLAYTVTQRTVPVRTAESEFMGKYQITRGMMLIYVETDGC
jgi:hypothetical protein